MYFASTTKSQTIHYKNTLHSTYFSNHKQTKTVTKLVKSNIGKLVSKWHRAA